MKSGTPQRKTTKPKTGKPAKKKVVDPLRKRAEALLRKRLGREKSKGLFDQEMQRLIHELKTHQIELEIQNEELRDAQTALLDANERYRDLYDFAPAGYFTFDGRGIILDVNLTGASMLGVERRYLLGRTFMLHLKRDLKVKRDLKRDYMDFFNAHIHEVLKSGERRLCELELTRRNGTTFLAVLESVPGAVHTVRTAISDITERKRAETEVLKLGETMAARNLEIEEKNRDLEAFMYSFSHDLRAPLRHISEFARILGEDYRERLDDRGRDYLQRIRRGTEKMSLLIDGLLNLSKILRQEVNRMRVDLSKLCASIVFDLRAADPGRTVEMIVPEGITAHADLRLTEIILSNLLGNAWKFTSKTEAARIEFGSFQKSGSSVYYIKDNGTGFDRNYADKMFLPFQRLHSEKEFPGTGIGLTIVERIVHRHGGRVWAEAEVDKGATFFISLEGVQARD